jgi:hypothetical protein
VVALVPHLKPLWLLMWHPLFLLQDEVPVGPKTPS